MTNFVADASNDAALDQVANTATALHVCSGDPADRAGVLSTSLGTVAIDNTDFTNADGDVSGRKHTIGAQSIASADASGTAAVVAIIDGTDLLQKHDLDATQAITAGNPIDVAAFAREIRDPA